MGYIVSRYLHFKFYNFIITRIINRFVFIQLSILYIVQNSKFKYKNDFENHLCNNSFTRLMASTTADNNQPIKIYH